MHSRNSWQAPGHRMRAHFQEPPTAFFGLSVTESAWSMGLNQYVGSFRMSWCILFTRLILLPYPISQWKALTVPRIETGTAVSFAFGWRFKMATPEPTAATLKTPKNHQNLSRANAICCDIMTRRNLSWFCRIIASWAPIILAEILLPASSIVEDKEPPMMTFFPDRVGVFTMVCILGALSVSRQTDGRQCVKKIAHEIG
mmetsp:Transcript_52471/g.131988  ORF Transcript_52471/g.131988 Transcript_52471/m.131988 type:complete len:200 (-) Transcript_52471:242-841(-)